MAVLEGGLLFRSTFASAGAHRWSIPTPGARRSEHQRGVLCRCALSIIQRFLVEDSEQVQVSHSLARDDRLEVHVGKGKEVALRASFRPLPHAAGRVAGVTVRGKDGRSQKAKQKRLISTISLFSLVFKRRATGEKAPSSAHRESAKSALFL